MSGVEPSMAFLFDQIHVGNSQFNGFIHGQFVDT